ncbi:helix-turn-helix domain-containing protein [Nonomuraea basaltis]|nr:helix-turn-helix domain-containing protein [Nonomuraea basaltis]
MSREHLIRSFTRATGCPPYAWHLQARLAEGRRRPRHGQAVADVAHALGFADLPADMLRPAVLSGVERLLEGPPPSRPAPRAPGRRRGRPGAMTPEAVETARRMHASGEHTAAEIARTLGVSRATLYRHLADEFRDTIRDTIETPACRRDQRSRGSRPVRRSTAGRGPKRLTA